VLPILQARRLGQSGHGALQASDGSIRTSSSPARPVTAAGAGDADETSSAVRRARRLDPRQYLDEFRTPLAAQLASIELLKDGLAGMPRAEIESWSTHCSGAPCVSRA